MFRHFVWHSLGDFTRQSALRAGCLAAVAVASFAAHPASAQNPQWIWSPDQAVGNVEIGDCYFRKSFTVRAPEQGEIAIVADDAYELYINGRRVGSGGGWTETDTYDISRFLNRGRNTLAVKASNTEGRVAGLAARVTITERGGAGTVYLTDDSWKTNERPFPLWQRPGYSDSRWRLAHEIGPVGTTEPWVEDRLPREDQENASLAGGRFTHDPAFEVEYIATHEETGSIIAMAFNEFGHILFSVEGGPLKRIVDSDEDGIPDEVQTYCDEITNCQGILPLSGDLYVTADGPDGAALYRLRDEDHNGKIDSITPLIHFGESMGEHGVHGLTLGPDGMIYMVVGNHARPDEGYAETSPHRHTYEGDLVGPRYEDPGGHAVGVKAPGGVILRTNTEGSIVERVAGGLRNPYDLAFNSEGELFTHDSDMEWDEGTTWYRPTRVNHITPGGEYGWRSGWSKWPDYFIDSLPPTIETGRGSPTGMVVYNHFMYPMRFHDALFLCDWTRGRILAVKNEREGAGFQSTSRVFLEGHPLNVTDIDVGPDGWLYFSTGGRGTTGGIYRIVWRGEVPDEVLDLGEGIMAAIRQPQLQSAWGRQSIALLRREMGESWANQITGVARSTENKDSYRLRALELMVLAGPTPSTSLLVTLSDDPSMAIRAKAASLMGLQDSRTIQARLVELLDDDEPLVRRVACESLVRTGHQPPLESLLPLLASTDRHEVFAARLLLETMPAENWSDELLASEDYRIFLQGATALMIASPSHEQGMAIVDRCSESMEGFINDADFVDTLRVLQLAMNRAEIDPDDLTVFKKQLAREFPSLDDTINRELIRLLVYMQEPSIINRSLAQLSTDIPNAEKVHLAVHLRFLEEGWSSDEKIELLEFYETMIDMDAGEGLPRLVLNVARDFASQLNDEECQLILHRGAELPTAAVASLFRLARNPDADLVELMKDLDSQIAGREGESFDRLRMGVVAVLASDGSDNSLEYLRAAFDEQPDRRQTIAMGLAMQPGGENWDYLIRSLPILDQVAAPDILAQLATVPRQPDSPEAYRQTILLSLRVPLASDQAAELLQHWSDESPDADAEDGSERIAAWQDWFAQNYPEKLTAQLPEVSSTAQWDFDELVEHLATEVPISGSSEAGLLVFQTAQCAKCHRFGGEGERIGPDLSTISRRFQQREILESVLYPSHVIPDQYASQTIIDKRGRQFTGLVVPGPEGTVFVLQADGNKIEVDNNEIDEIAPSRASSMPEGLIDSLTLEQIVDLFAYLGTEPQRLANRPEEDETQ